MTFRSSVAVTALVVLLTTTAACGVGGNSATTSGNDSSTTASDTAPTATAGATSPMPAECQAYLNSVQACLDHVSAQNPAAVAQVRDTLDVNRTAIDRLNQAGPPVEYCVSANNAWESRKGNFGC